MFENIVRSKTGRDGMLLHKDIATGEATIMFDDGNLEHRRKGSYDKRQVPDHIVNKFYVQNNVTPTANLASLTLKESFVCDSMHETLFKFPKDIQIHCYKSLI